MRRSSALPQALCRRSLPGLLAVAVAVVGAAGMTSCYSLLPASSQQQQPVFIAAQDYGQDRSPSVRAALPNARIYRTSTDVDALVPVTVNPADGRVLSYPAPSDITGASMPVVLRDGWLLDRRGVGRDTRFVRYTYSQYHDLVEAPSPADIADAVVPDARVIEIVELPYKTGEVTPAMADSIISGGLERCEVIFRL